MCGQSSKKEKTYFKLFSVHFCLSTYICIYQVVGHKEGLDVMERADPLFLLIGLPTIPVMLILGKMIRWEDYVLRLWRKYSNKLQILNSIFPGNMIINLKGNIKLEFLPLGDGDKSCFAILN